VEGIFFSLLFRIFDRIKLEKRKSGGSDHLQTRCRASLIRTTNLLFGGNMIATATRSTYYQPHFPWPLLTAGVVIAILALAAWLTTMFSANPRFNPQLGDITRSEKGTTIALTWQSTDGFCQINGKLTLPDSRSESYGQRVFAPCQGQDVRRTWENLVSKIFERFAEQPDLLKEIIPVVDTIRSVLSGVGI